MAWYSARCQPFAIAAPEIRQWRHPVRLANYAGRAGDFADARQAIARAQRLDQLNPAFFRNAGVIEYGGRNYDGDASARKTTLTPSSLIEAG